MLFFIQSVLLSVVLVTVFILPVMRNEKAIYLVIAEYFFFPSYTAHTVAGGALSISGISYFTLLQAAQGLGLLAAIVIDAFVRREKYLYNRFEFVLVGLFALIFAVQFYVQVHAGDVFTIVPVSSFISNNIEVAAAIIFLMASIIFIRTQAHLERAFEVVIICGFILSIEMLLTYFLPTVKETIGHWTLLGNGKFRSLFLGDAVAVPLWSVLAAIMSFYFYQIYGYRRYLICFAVCLLPVFLDFTRSVLIGLVCAGFVWLYLSQRRRRYRIALLMTAAVMMAGFFASITVLNEDKLDRQELAMISQMTPASYAHYIAEKNSTKNYFMRRYSNLNTMNSSLIRVGQAVRGFEVLETTLPLGVGPNFLRYYMVSGAIPVMDHVHLDAYSPDLHKGYDRVALNHVQTEAQIGYLDFIFSFGVPGLVLEVLAVLYIFLTFEKWRTFVEMFTPTFFLGLSVYCMLIVYGVFFFFNTTPTLYVVLMLLLHAGGMLAVNRAR